MTILCNELTLEQVNAALLRIQRSIQSNTNNFQNDVGKAVANVTVNSKNTVQKYDDSYLMSLVADLRDKYKNLNTITQDNILNIIKLETILANASLDYDENTNAITFNLGDYSTTFTLKDTTYDFSYDTETGDFKIVDNVTGETVFEETFNDTTYTFSFNNGVLTIHNNLTDVDQTFNFDARYYTEAEIQALILDKIPTQASSTNQLADKDFVNSSIATSTATFRGTVTTTTALAALTGDANDYAFLQNIDPVTGLTLSYDRYKWVESGGDYGHWKYEYTLNNSSFTSDQWAAINSGITCQIVQDLIDGCYSCESNIDVYCNTTCKCTINSANPLCLCANAFKANATISTTTYPGACCTGNVKTADIANFITMSDVDACGYTTCTGTVTGINVFCGTTCKCKLTDSTPLCLGSNAFNSTAFTTCKGTVTILDKVAANSDTPVALCTGETSVGKSGSCGLNFNTCCGILKTRCYCVDGHGYAKFAIQNLTATNIGLTAGCCYPLTCILESLMACYGYKAGTYSFVYSSACNPIICETGGYAYCAVFTKEDHANPVANTWNMTRWRVTLNDGRSYCASAYSVATAGIACWNVQGSTAVRICRKAVSDDATCYLALLGGNSDNHAACIYVSNSCPLTFNPATGVLSAKCFVGDNQYHAVIPSPNGNTSSYYATIVLEGSCTSANASIVFNSYYAEYHLLTWYNGTSCLTEVKDLWYVDCKYSIDSVGVSTCKANTDCIYIKYCGYRPTIINSSKKIKCVVYGCTTAPSNVSWTAAVKGIKCSRDTTCFGGCTYADACTDIRSGLISGGSFNGISGTVDNGLLSFSNINFDNICNSPSKNVAANNITRRYLLTNQITSVGYITRWGLGLERGTTGWGTGLLSLGIKDDGTCFADYKFTSGGSISLTCCGTAKCITLSGCATKNVYTCCLGSASNTRRYYQIKTKANRGSASVSFDFDFFSMNGTINLDNGIGNQYYAGGYYGNLCVSVCSYTCACCDCFWLTYSGYRSLTLKSVYDFEVLCNTTTAPEDVTFCCFVRRPGSVTKIGVSDDASYNILLSNAANDTAMPSIGSNGKLTFNPSTGILDVSCGTCIGWYRTKSCCVKVTPTAQSSCWIYIGRYQTNGTGDTTNTYNELNLTIAAIGSGMVSSANIKILSANAAAPTVIVQRQCGYSASTGIDCVAVTRSGSTWNCYVCVWARVVSSGTYNYYLHLYRNMLPDSWTTALTVCSAITGDVVGVGNIGINQRAIQSNVPLRIGSLVACTSSVTGCAGSFYGAGFMEMYAGTPYIDFHVNNYCGDYSQRIIACAGVLKFGLNNGTGCTASTESATYYMCSNGLLYSARGFVAGTINAACSFVYIDCACGGRMISLGRAPGADVGLMLSHCADWAGTTYCNLGIEIGSGNVNRGFYHCKAGTFEWLQYWDATYERHNCPQCFACPIYGCSSATFAGCVLSCNTQRWSTVYSSNTYNTGYYLIAEYKTNENGSGNHDITIGGCVDIAGSTACKTMRFKASIRGNKCTPSFYCAWVDSSLAADCLVFTRSVDTDTCTFALRIYGKINAYYTRFNTTIDYIAGGDVNVRKSNQYNCLTFPNTYAAATSDFCGTVIPISCNCGNLVATTYKTNATNITCSFAAGSTSYILLGCYTPSNTAGNANELDLGFALGGGSLVEKGSLKLLLTNGSCNASCFSNNNIEAKFSNYADTSYGVRKLIFTSSGNSWSCSIGIWLEVCNPGSAACSWSVDLLRNRVDSRFTASLTCAAATSGTRVCTIEVPSNKRNYYFNNADNNLLGTWTNPTCVRHYNTSHCCTMTAIIPMCCLPSSGMISYCLGFSNHFEAEEDVPAMDCLTSIFIDLSLSGCGGGTNMIKFCVSNGYSYITPYKVSLVRISSCGPEGLHINFAICCTLECFDLYTSYCTLINKTPGSCLYSLPSSVIPTISNGELVSSVSGLYGCTVMVYADSEGAVAMSTLNASIIQTRNLAVTSSIKSKKCIEPLRENALGILKDTNVVRYKYKSEGSDEPKHVGIIAEFTDSIMSGSRKDHFNVSDSVGLLIDAVKDIEASLSLWQRLKIKIYRKFIKSKKDKSFMNKINKSTNK